MGKPNPLLDVFFLQELDNYRNRVTYVRMTSLTVEGYPIEQIEGVATGGNITVNGDSAVRRICNLTMTTKKLNINNIYWGISARVKIEIGLWQEFTEKYDNLIWFPMGVYVITDFKTSQQVNNYTITLSGKDKMCLLNGDISGNFNAETDLGKESVEQEDGTFVNEERSIPYIIREMIHYYAQEPFENIIIKDINSLGLDVMRNHTDHEFYLAQNVKTQEYVDIIDPTSDSNYNYTYPGNIKVDFNNLPDNFVFANGVDEDDTALVPQAQNPTVVIDGQGIQCYLTKVNAEEDIGYQVRDLTYPEDLIAAPNETVTSILDKIIKTFGDYEYFYNIDGQFVFQAKQTYVNTSWNNIVYNESEFYVKPSMLSSLTQYNFEGSKLTTAYQNTPNIGKIKNDYTVWGKKKMPSSGVEIPIHMRYAIDSKPYFYGSYKTPIYSKDGATLFSEYQDIYVTQEFFDTVVAKNLDKGETIANYKKTIQPPTWLANSTIANGGNPDDWWAVTDWAEYYKSLSGSYPMQQLRHYITGEKGYQGKMTFGDGTTHTFNNQSIFDVDSNGVPYTGSVPSILGYAAMPYWFPFQHSYRGCTHTFEFFRQLDELCNLTSWFYQPRLPDELAIYEEIIYNGKYKVNIVDWREIIYQMAKDYYLHNHDDDFYVQVHRNNFIPLFGLDLYQNGRTGYEHYYHDIQGFWRQLYAPQDVYDWNKNELELDLDNYNDDGWHKDIENSPSSLLFWFDFLDADSLGVGQFSVPAIGNRPKVSKNDSIRSIIYKDIPDVVFIKISDYEKYSENNQLPGDYTYVKITEYDDEGHEVNRFLANYIEDNKIIKSARSVTAQEEIDKLLYECSYANENITITSVPIYYLEPNCIISAKDEDSLRIVNGYYILNKATIPLTYNGTMQITATRVPERIY